jgi:dTDP-4-dehydrorhamnose 3,5-epimerase
VKFSNLSLDGLVLIEPDVFKDGRGFFLETYNFEKYRKKGMPLNFVQDNHSSSARGTLRGLHAQLKYPQGKLVRTIDGEIFDVVVDVRPDSKTFGEWEGFTLSAENFLQIYIPPGFLHGFCVLSETAQVEYKCTDFYRPEDEIAVLWSDPDLKINWPMKNPQLSKRDQNASKFNEVKTRFDIYRGNNR